MSDRPSSELDSNRPGGRFATTAWSLVAAAGARESPLAQAALADLCRRYWYPLYAYLRRSGESVESAGDLIQGFFAELLERNLFDVADPERGRFRSFLLAALKNFCANQRRFDRAIKRGGQATRLSIDCAAGEERYVIEPQHALTAERLYERKWALQLLDRCIQRLEIDAGERGRGELFQAVRPILSGHDAESTYGDIAARLGMTASAVKVAVHRWRTQLRESIRDEIQETVSSPDEVDEEIEQLFRALAME